jgi:soluble lytic murein transglycosylase-like protein
MRFCFIIFWAGVASNILAAQTQRITTVVRPDHRSGKLVRSVVVSPRTMAPRAVAERMVAPREVPPAMPRVPSAAVTGIDAAVERIAAEHDLSPQLIHSVIKVESNYNPFAVSSKGALGLMQLVPATARRFGVADVFNPVENIQGGAKYLKYLLDLYGNNYALALAAYNAGEGAVAKYGAVPPYRETQSYLQLVAAQLRKANAEASKLKPPKPAVKTPETEATSAQPAGPNHIREIVQPDGTVRYVTR